MLTLYSVVYYTFFLKYFSIVLGDNGDIDKQAQVENLLEYANAANAEK